MISDELLLVSCGHVGVFLEVEPHLTGLQKGCSSYEQKSIAASDVGSLLPECKLMNGRRHGV